MHLRLPLNLLHFIPDLGALYTMRPTFLKFTLGDHLHKNVRNSAHIMY
jgi:hypothetical protein